jgi:hypothetical protein
MLERYLLGVEKLNKSNENKIAVDITRMEQLLRKAKANNFAVKVEESVRKMMAQSASELYSMAAESGVEKAEEEVVEGKVVENRADKIIIVKEMGNEI